MKGTLSGKLVRVDAIIPKEGEVERERENNYMHLRCTCFSQPNVHEL